MENEVEPVVGGTVGAEHGPEGNSETRREWVAPKLRKVDVAEVTAAGGINSKDAVLSS
jgi:hypothetical protein